MSRWVLLLVCLFLSDSAQALMKVGVDKLGGLSLRAETILAECLKILTSFPIMLGILFYGIGLLMWLKVLGDYDDFIQAMMYSTLHYAFILLISLLIFREKFTLYRGMGFVIIVVGILVFSMGDPSIENLRHGQ